MAMKIKIFLALVLFGLATTLQAQQSQQGIEKWNWLISEWKGEGAGQPGQGAGSFTFSYNLDSKIIERKAHTEFPATADKPKAVHDDLLFVYTDFSGNLSKAIYFDNEGHTINYTVSYQDKNIIFQSEKIENMPIFRLTYTPIDSETVNTKFEMSRDGQTFTTYIEGKSKRVK